jgi:orotate phosphoribosyltransferase-like protein
MGRTEKGRPTVLQEDIFRLWVQGLCTKDICQQLECSDETVRSVKKNETYKKLFYERQRDQVIELIPIAIRRLKDILHDPDAKEDAQIKAVKEVFDRARLNELTDDPDKEIKITVSYE